MPGVTTPDTLPDDVAALRALVLTAWAERDAERAENGRLADQNERLRHLIRQLGVTGRFVQNCTLSRLREERGANIA
jgi:hypothetical protein